MSTQVLERPIKNDVELVEDNDEFCHIICTCRPRITLCGALNNKYPQSCGDLGNNLIRKRCRGCGKRVCKLCLAEVYNPCPSCGSPE